jgi:hypothetical protein
MFKNRLRVKFKRTAGISVLSVVVTAAASNLTHANDELILQNGSDIRQDDGGVAKNGDPSGFDHSSTLSRSVNYLEGAPYICTPSGFGEKAKCFLRSSLRANRR